MFFQHVYDKSLAQGSYLIGCQATGEAIVIDAQRDIDVYLDIAKQNNLRITHITETHIHADYLCGSRELAAVTGATMCLSDEGGAEFFGGAFLEPVQGPNINAGKQSSYSHHLPSFGFPVSIPPPNLCTVYTEIEQFVEDYTKTIQ